MRILILCTGNSCRSQMAEAYLRHLMGDKWEIYSAGIEAHGLNSKMLQVLEEDGINTSSLISQTIEEYKNENFDYLITVCDNAKESCPYFAGHHKSIHFSFPDPAKTLGTEKEILESFRMVRDSIKDFCQKLIQEILKQN